MLETGIRDCTQQLCTQRPHGVAVKQLAFKRDNRMKLQTIALEEHFVTRSFLDAVKEIGGAPPPELHAKLLDLGGGRIATMDAAEIDLQVLSLAALGFDRLKPVLAIEVARQVNEELAAAIAQHPTRLAGFATLPMREPEQAAEELERCIAKLGFVGAMIDGTTDGLFLDDPRFLTVWQTAARLKVPIYVHPAPPPATVQQAYFSGLPGELGHLLSIAGWGWHAEAGLHLLRLIVSGLFDRLPSLQVIAGHMGEGLPYALARSSPILSAAASLRQPVAAYFRSNIHITTSGYFSLPPLQCALEVVGVERMMFSVDYPFSPNPRGRDLLRQAAEILSPDQLAAFAAGNAARLLGLGE